MALVAAIQMNSSDDLVANLQQAEQLIAQAASQQAGLVVLPENFATFAMSYQQLLAQKQNIKRAVIECMQRLAQQYKVYISAGSYPEYSEQQHKFYARNLLLSPQGEVLAVYDKMHLFQATLDDVTNHYAESDYYCAGDKIRVVDTPLGKIGTGICFDLRFPEFFRVMFQQCVDVILLPSAFTQLTGEAHWLTLLRARAIENACYIIAANQSGIHSNNRKTYGHSCIISPWGEILANAEKNQAFVLADISSDNISQARSKISVHDCQRIQVIL